MSDLTDKEKEKLLRALESEGAGDPEEEAQARRDFNRSIESTADKIKSLWSMPAILREIGKQPVLEPPSIDDVEDVGPSKTEEQMEQLIAEVRKLQQPAPSLSLSDLVAVPKPQPRFTRAYQSWEYALEKTGQPFERGEAYDWLKENGCPQYEDDELDKQLPLNKTWLTYLRKALKTRGR